MSRIAIVAHCHFPISEPFAGGLEMHTALTARLLARQGHHVTLFAKAGSEVDGCEIFPVVPKEFSFQPLATTTFGGRRQVARLRHSFERAMRYIGRSDFDFVINNTLNGVPLEMEPSAPTLTIFHTPVILGIVNSARIATRHSGHAFATVSNVNRDDWARFLGGIDVIPNGIELSQWTETETNTNELRWSARVTPEKGLDVAIDAARLSDRALRIVGPISNREYFEDTIKPMLGNSISYEGHLHHRDLNDFLSSGAASVCTPLWEEPFGLTVVEAFATGTPVAALPRGAIPELVNSSVGAIGKDSSAQALSSAIDEACTKKPSVCRAYAEENFDANQMVDSYMRTLNAIAATEDLDPVNEATCSA